MTRMLSRPSTHRSKAPADAGCSRQSATPQARRTGSATAPSPSPTTPPNAEPKTTLSSSPTTASSSPSAKAAARNRREGIWCFVDKNDALYSPPSPPECLDNSSRGPGQAPRCPRRSSKSVWSEAMGAEASIDAPAVPATTNQPGAKTDRLASSTNAATRKHLLSLDRHKPVNYYARFD